jgi:Fe(3+) dicitrate transport protein
MPFTPFHFLAFFSKAQKNCIFVLFSLFAFPSLAEDSIEEIKIFPDTRPTWQESDKTKILSGKKNSISRVDYLPPIQTDNNRQLLSQLPGLLSAEQATEPWTVINYRGFGTPQEAQSLLLLQDGLPVAIDIYGQPDNLYSPPGPLMESIQVIAGGSALLYGPAPGGAINYISPKLSQNQPTKGRVNIAGGSYNLLSTVNTLSGFSGKTSYNMGYYRKQGDGYQRTNGDFFSDYLQFKTNTYLGGNTVFKTSFQGFDSDYGMPGGMALKTGPGLNTWGGDNRKATRKNNRLRISRAQLMLGVEKKLSVNTFMEAQVWSTAYRKYNKTQTGSGFGRIPVGNATTINNSHSYGLNGEVRVRHAYDDHQLSAGYFLYNTNSPSVNESGSGEAANHGTVTSRLYRKTRTQALFIENQFHFGKLSVVPGARFENITLSATNDDKTGGIDLKRSDTYNVLLGGIGSTWSFTDETQAFANISQGFKPIGYEEVLTQGNPNYTVSGDIKPSFNYFYESGIRGEGRKLNWDTSVYVVERQNILASSNNVLSNGGSARYEGIESSLIFKDIFGTRSSSEYDFYVNTNFLNAKFRRGSFKGKTPGHAPSALVKLGLIYRLHQKLHASLMATYVNEHYSDDAHTADFRVPSYTLYDLLGEYSFNERWAMNGAINNLLDRQYYGRVMVTGVMPTMGRNMYLGASCKF